MQGSSQSMGINNNGYKTDFQIRLIDMQKRPTKKNSLGWYLIYYYYFNLFLADKCAV